MCEGRLLWERVDLKQTAKRVMKDTETDMNHAKDRKRETDTSREKWREVDRVAAEVEQFLNECHKSGWY